MEIFNEDLGQLYYSQSYVVTGSDMGDIFELIPDLYVMVTDSSILNNIASLSIDIDGKEITIVGDNEENIENFFVWRGSTYVIPSARSVRPIDSKMTLEFIIVRESSDVEVQGLGRSFTVEVSPYSEIEASDGLAIIDRDDGVITLKGTRTGEQTAVVRDGSDERVLRFYIV